jgi:hypothetical protein
VQSLPTLTHDQLLTLAEKTRAAARDHERDRLEASIVRLFQALTDHLRAERPDLMDVAHGGAYQLERGQQHIIDLLIELAATAAANPSDCRCNRLADSVLTELRIQADSERRHLISRSPMTSRPRMPGR